MEKGTTKIFLGNLGDGTTADMIRPMFEAFGKVVEADVITNYGFIHMEEFQDAERAIAALAGKEVCGRPMNVELSTGYNKRGGKTAMGAKRARSKLFVGNLHKDVQLEELQSLFEQHGAVAEADIVFNYAFVHMEKEEQANAAMEALDGHMLHGQAIRVQFSSSTVRQQAGMDKSDMCFRCGSHGHWSKDCSQPGPRRDPSGYGGHGGYGGPAGAADGWGGGYGRERARYAPYPAYAPPPPPPPYRRDPYYETATRRDYYDAAYYDPYGDSELYERRRPAPLPAMHDPYGPPPRRHPDEELLYDRRPTLAAYRY